MSNNGQKKRNGNGNGNGNRSNGNGKKAKPKKDSLRDIGLASTVVLGMLLAPIPTIVVVGSAFLGAKRQEKKQKKLSSSRGR